MNAPRRTMLAWAVLVCIAAGAQAEPLPQGGDPVLPPALRQQPSTQPSPAGAALQAQVEEKLKQAFDAADVGRQGSLTKDQAARVGWAMVVREFDRIDATRSGRVSFEDIRRFVRARDAAR